MTEEQRLAKKVAKAAYDRAYRAKNREKITAAKKLWGQSEVKKAYDKKWAEDNRERSREIKAAWKARNPDADREYYEQNTETIRSKRKAYYYANREAACAYTAKWVRENPDKARELYRRMYQKNRHAYVYRARARRSKIVLATPKWADLNAISTMYAEASRLGMHVDHIVPLQGKTVCGLHVEQNLQLLTPKENLSKGNRHAG